MKEILETYGSAVLCMLYFLKKDWESFQITKQMVEIYTNKLKEIIDSITNIQSLSREMVKEINGLKTKVKNLEKENSDLRNEIKKKLERRN